MSTSTGLPALAETGSTPTSEVVTVRYWAAARAAAGIGEDRFAVSGPVSLAEILAWVARAHPGPRMAEVLAVCAALVGDRPVGTADPAQVTVRPGEYVEFLPPFAGG